MGKLKWCPSARKYKMCMVSSHTWHNSHQRTATPYQHGTLWLLPAMYSGWFFGTSFDCLGEGRTIWQYTKTPLATMLRTIPARIPDDWALHPHFNIWPPKRHRAILWVLANVVIFRIQQQTTLTLHDFMDFLLRSRWKLMSHKHGRDLVGNYLTVTDPQWWTSTGGQWCNIWHKSNSTRKSKSQWRITMPKNLSAIYHDYIY